jgi:hypothetical protein
VLGYVNAENLSLMPAPGEETLIYVCGPAGFMDLISGIVLLPIYPRVTEKSFDDYHIMILTRTKEISHRISSRAFSLDS